MAEERKRGEPAVFVIKKEAELRFKVQPGCTAKVKLVKGLAEVFGAELLRDKEYTFAAGRTVPIFSWYGATVRISDGASVGSTAYVAEDTPMTVYANLHQCLEFRRGEARKAAAHGPRVMVVGPTDAGKSSLARILLSYAVRTGRAPLFMDLDVGQGELSCPGTICATVMTKTSLDPQIGFVLTSPLVYSLGATTPSANLDLYRTLVEKMSTVVNRRLADPDVRASGMIINTCGWVDGDGYDLLLHAARTLSVDVVLVLGHDQLHAQLTRELTSVTMPGISADAGASADGGGVKQVSVASANKAVTVVKLQRSGSRIKEYFYGPDGGLSPTITTLSFDEISLCKIGGDKLDDDMLRPVGKESVLDPVALEVVEPQPEMEHALLAVACTKKQEEVVGANVAGFVLLQGVNVEKRTVMVLTPCPGPLPSRFLVLSNITFVE